MWCESWRSLPCYYFETVVRVCTVVDDEEDEAVVTDETAAFGAAVAVGATVADAVVAVAGTAVAVDAVSGAAFPALVATFATSMVVADGGADVATAAALAAWLCSACLPIRALSATKPATPTVVTRRFQVRLRSFMRGFIIVGSLSHYAKPRQDALPVRRDEEEREDKRRQCRSQDCRLHTLLHLPVPLSRVHIPLASSPALPGTSPR
jgi:hypothetical protein